MAKRKRKTTTKRGKTSSKPIGFTKVGKKYALVYGSKSKPRLGKSRFNTKKTLVSAARKKLQ